jgi:hypothetical protein
MKKREKSLLGGNGVSFGVHPPNAFEARSFPTSSGLPSYFSKYIESYQLVLSKQVERKAGRYVFKTAVAVAVVVARYRSVDFLNLYIGHILATNGRERDTR